MPAGWTNQDLRQDCVRPAAILIGSRPEFPAMGRHGVALPPSKMTLAVPDLKDGTEQGRNWDTPDGCFLPTPDSFAPPPSMKSCPAPLRPRPGRKATRTLPRGGLPTGAVRRPAATGRCLTGGSPATGSRRRRCSPASPMPQRMASAPRRPGPMTPSGSNRPCKPRTSEPEAAADKVEPCAFEQLFVAGRRRRRDAVVGGHRLGAPPTISFVRARAGLRRALLETLSGLCAPALYERFAKSERRTRRRGPAPGFTCNLSPTCRPADGAACSRTTRAAAAHRHAHPAMDRRRRANSSCASTPIARALPAIS